MIDRLPVEILALLERKGHLARLGVERAAVRIARLERARRGDAMRAHDAARKPCSWLEFSYEHGREVRVSGAKFGRVPAWESYVSRRASSREDATQVHARARLATLTSMSTGRRLVHSRQSRAIPTT